MDQHLSTSMETGIKETWNPSHEEYFAEFAFTNAKFLEMIDTILQGSDHEPIIIFQADHSTSYGAWYGQKIGD